MKHIKSDQKKSKTQELREKKKLDFETLTKKRRTMGTNIKTRSINEMK